MTVASLRLYHLSAPLPETIGNALVFFDRRETLLVEAVGPGGVSGWGETWAAPQAAAAIIAARLAPKVLGQDPQHLGRLWHAMCAAIEPDLQGTAMTAVAAVDMALHDLSARLRGVPLSTVLGGAVRDRVPAYASGPFFKPNGHPYRDFEREAGGYVEAGFRAIKLRSGYAPKDDAAVLAAVRRTVGDDVTLMLDFNQSYHPRAALAAAERMTEAGLLWIEEPAVPTDLEGYRMLSRHMGPALAGGETYGSAAQFKPFLESGCMDVLQPDIAICGGLTGTGRVAALAELFDRPVVPHVWGGTVNFHAALHFSATLPAQRLGAATMPYLEFDAGPNPLLDLAGRPKLDSDGTVRVPDGPGLGLELTPATFERFLVASETLSA